MQRVEYMVYYPLSIYHNFWLVDNGKNRNIKIWHKNIVSAKKAFNQLIDAGFKEVSIIKTNLVTNREVIILQSIRRNNVYK